MFYHRIVMCLLFILPSFLPAKTLSEQKEKITHYSVTIQINGANDVGDTLFGDDISSTLRDHLSLVEKSNIEEINDGQKQFLLDKTPQEVEQILNTLGYFNNQTEIKNTEEGYLIDVSLGKKITVENLIVVLEGPINEDERLPFYYQDIFLNWRLYLGEHFTQNEWAADKSRALMAITQKKYPQAKISHSEALIDPQKSSSILTLYIDSQEAVRFGQIRAKGYDRYPKSIIANMADFSSGSDYDVNKLLDYQAALEQDSHYSNVLVSANFDEMADNTVPVDVVVNEVPRQKVDIGLSYDSEEGAGLRLGYDHYNMFKRGYTGSAVFDINSYEQSLSLGVAQPRNGRGKFWTSGVNFSNKSAQNLQSRTANAGLWYARVRDGIDSRLGVEYYLDSSKIKDGQKFGTQYVTMLTASWKRNKITTRTRPANGYYLFGKVGTTVGSMLSTANIQRAEIDGAYYFTPKNRQIGTLIIRGGAAYIFAKKQEKVPAGLLFRTGGAQSVRGYEADSIGIAGENGTVLGGKAKVVAGIEYNIPIKHDYAVAVFHDAGGVDNHFRNIDIKHATGIGVRWYSPVAPLAFDIAYAHENRKIGWHINLGTRF